LSRAQFTPILSLIDTPGIGQHWNSPDSRLAGLRHVPVTPYRNYLIFFRATEDAVEVFRVVHGARELESIVEEIPIYYEQQ
jgi:toxin ParE1/3/4